MTDYGELIDSEIRDFIAKTQAAYPDDTTAFSIDDQRRVYDEMCVRFRQPYPPGVTARDRPLGGVPCRIYETGTAGAVTVLYLHGGGFVVGGLHSHDDVCAEIAAATGYRVVSADYRLSPEHRHPAAFEDACAAAVAVAASWPGRLIVAGDSAGANLAAAATHALRGTAAAPAGQVLIYGSFSPDVGCDGSYARHAEAPLLTRADLEFYRDIRFAPGGRDPADATAAPLADRDFAGLPPTFLLAAECDPLADDSAAYAARLRAAGGRAHSVLAPGLVHGFLRARHMSARAADAFGQITGAVAALGRGAFPWDAA